MPSPTSSSKTSTVPQTVTDPYLDSLLHPVKWGGAVGTGVTLTYSFPWLNGASAVFAGYLGEDYSRLQEDTATLHYGLDTTQQGAVRAALLTWSAVANITFSEVADTSTSVGDLRFAWTSAQDASDNGSAAWGWASYPNAFWPSGGDTWISIDPSGAIDTDWSVGSYNFAGLIHEAGHALGLKHPFEGSPTLPIALDNLKYSVMSYTDTDSLFVNVGRDSGGNYWEAFYVQPDTPMLLDVAAIQYIYGANMTYRTGDDVYSFDPGTPFLRTLWDAGGNDTISVSNFTEACVIDLGAGKFSTITIRSDSTDGYSWSSPPPKPTYDGTPNLAIAYGCTIENAVGGAGNDHLIGNGAGNRLTGGGGNDTLEGGAGLDTAVFVKQRSAYTIAGTSTGFAVSGAEGADTLTGIERLVFLDASVALDIDGTGGQAYRLYQAAFNRTPDAGGLGYWIAALDDGASLASVAQGFVTSAEFKSVYGASPTNAQLVTRYYENVLHRAPEAGGYNFWVGVLDQQQDSAAGVLASISESAENKAGVIGVIGNGFAYTPYA